MAGSGRRGPRETRLISRRPEERAHRTSTSAASRVSAPQRPGSGRSAGEGLGDPLQSSWASLAAQLVKNPPAMWEALV